MLVFDDIQHILPFARNIKTFAIGRGYDAVRVARYLDLTGHLIGRGIDDGDVIAAAVGDVDVGGACHDGNGEQEEQVLHSGYKNTPITQFGPIWL